MILNHLLSYEAKLIFNQCKKQSLYKTIDVK